MPSHKYQFDDLFWSWFKSLDQFQGQMRLESFLQFHPKLTFNESKMYQAYQYLRKFYPEFKIFKKDGKTWIDKPSVRDISISMSVSELVSILLLPASYIQANENTFLCEIGEMINRVEDQYPEWALNDLYSNNKERQTHMESLNHEKQMFVDIIEKAISDHQCIEIQNSENKYSIVYPHKFIYLDGSLNLIAEDINDRCLLAYSFLEIEDMQMTEHNYHHNYGPIEVEDFIQAFRAISECDARLVMKILHPENVDLCPQFHFLGNPYITSNANGELIWAANVEPSEELYDWLNSMEDHVEVLDPDFIKDELHEYKNGKVMTKFKKVS